MPEIPLEKMQERFQTARGSETFEDKMSRDLFFDTKEWDYGDVVRRCEEHYGVSLSDTERAAWTLKLRSYRNGIAAARSYYGASLHRTVFDVLERDGVEKHLRVPSMAALPREEAKKVFASINGPGMILMRMMRDDHPELYRRGKVHHYISFIMMDDVEAFFEAKAAGR